MASVSVKQALVALLTVTAAPPGTAGGRGFLAANDSVGSNRSSPRKETNLICTRIFVSGQSGDGMGGRLFRLLEGFLRTDQALAKAPNETRHVVDQGEHGGHEDKRQHG